ncbi:hypothetical protein Ancab_021928 [Ancistrocladus abbreviatus]
MVDVMRECVDFLHKLGLTTEDIINYPLFLGYHVKKNMIPMLDYLGKLGVRKSSLSDFLRRYPQVLHASVAVGLQPVLKYLQGMDIKLTDIPHVLKRYPEVLGFKLCSDKKFEERMTYESIDLEEMETEPTFDMNSLMVARSDEFGSECKESDEEDL